ncbi:hypothetical protein E8E12_007216 [Didymella heteroderae]|uniref:Heme binding n=1 Tax=Didymella heteroderae TaxID=1769908 RepID=A0A9P5C3J9_9PLEO|nr:hypothetical protein E8E12_007216 [Didymella heteroderae]
MGVLSTFADSAFTPTVILLLLFCTAYLFLRSQLLETDEYPIINKYPFDWTHRKAKAVFAQDASGLIRDGFAKFKRPFRIITALGSRVILPSEYAEWVRKSPDVSHQALVAEDFFAGHPGFEGVTAVSDPSETLIGLIKSRLSQNKFVDQFSNCALVFLHDSWGEAARWHEITWAKDGTNLIGRMSSSVFVGEQLARNEQWQKISISYAVNMFQGARVLRSWPAWTRPYIHWFLKECKVCRAEVKNAGALLKSEIQRRSPAVEKYEDTITWMHNAAKGRPYNATSTQLGLSMAAVITTSELLKQSLINICAHSELIGPLREEIKQAVDQEGWSAATLAQMLLLDSVIKETQRLYPMSEVNLERKVVRNTTLPNGQHLRGGTNISVSTSRFFDPEVYERPTDFDGTRFLKLRKQGGKWENSASVVSTNSDHFVFGLGKYICPGRFFAAAEVKTALAVILSEYDVRLHSDYVPKVFRYGFEILVDPEVRLEIRKRT